MRADSLENQNEVEKKFHKGRDQKKKRKGKKSQKKRRTKEKVEDERYEEKWLIEHEKADLMLCYDGE
jgi:hypothetical protein